MGIYILEFPIVVKVVWHRIAPRVVHVEVLRLFFLEDHDVQGRLLLIYKNLAVDWLIWFQIYGIALQVMQTPELFLFNYQPV